MRIPAEMARAIQLVVLDADGVMTDGSIGVLVDAGGGVADFRSFNVLDGMAIHLLRAAGLRVAIVSGKGSAAVGARAEELGVEELHQVSPFGKIEAVEGILRRNGLTWQAVAHLGDDLADLALMGRVGLPAAVANAVREVRERAVWVGAVPGGAGAVREFAEALLQARGEWDSVVEAYVAESGGGGTRG